MIEEVQSNLIPGLGQLEDSWIGSARLKMALVPSMGFFVIVPLISCPKLVELRLCADFEEQVEGLAAEIGWTFCFA